MNRPLCFVLMPRGKKPDPDGALVDFDAVYHNLVAPAVHSAGLNRAVCAGLFGRLAAKAAV